MSTATTDARVSLAIALWLNAIWSMVPEDLCYMHMNCWCLLSTRKSGEQIKKIRNGAHTPLPPCNNTPEDQKLESKNIQKKKLLLKCIAKRKLFGHHVLE